MGTTVFKVVSTHDIEFSVLGQFTENGVDLIRIIQDSVRCYVNRIGNRLFRSRGYKPFSCSTQLREGLTGAVVRASDFGPRGPWFDPRPVCLLLWP